MIFEFGYDFCIHPREGCEARMLMCGMPCAECAVQASAVVRSAMMAKPRSGIVRVKPRGPATTLTPNDVWGCPEAPV